MLKFKKMKKFLSYIGCIVLFTLCLGTKKPDKYLLYKPYILTVSQLSDYADIMVLYRGKVKTLFFSVPPLNEMSLVVKTEGALCKNLSDTLHQNLTYHRVKVKVHPKAKVVKFDVLADISAYDFYIPTPIDSLKPLFTEMGKVIKANVKWEKVEGDYYKVGEVKYSTRVYAN